MQTPNPAVHTVVIRPSDGWASLDLKEVWECRELLYFLVWRDLKVRYRQTVLGWAWAIVPPFMTMVVFTIFLGGLINVPSEGLPYPIFAYSGLLPWQLFSSSLTASSNSLVANESLIKKVYFPRLMIPLSASLVALVDFLIASVILLGLMVFYRITPTASLWLLPSYMLLALVTALGVGAWLSALNVKYRDVRYVVPFITQLWLFSTPIVYPSSLVPERWRSLYELNPMAGVVEGFRWALLGVGRGPSPLLAVSIGIALALFISGVYYFRRMERTFADIV